MVLYFRYQQGQSSPAETEDRQMSRIFTLADARDEKRNAELPALARADAKRADAARIAAILAANPQIGILQNEKGQRFYVNFPIYAEARDPASLVQL
jgi:hypothetical protein